LRKYPVTPSCHSTKTQEFTEADAEAVLTQIATTAK
jgi:hypothetical protein